MQISIEDLIQAIRNGDETTVSEFAAANPRISSEVSPLGVSFFMMALYVGQPAIARIFLDNGHQLNFFEAAAWGDADRVNFWLQQEPGLLNSFSIDGFQAIGLACFFNRENVVDALLHSGAEVNIPSRNFQQVMPLHSAAAADNLSICRKLIDHGAQVNARQQGGFTPLHAAAQNGNMELVRFFLTNGAELNARTNQGVTPLSMAKESKNEQLVFLLQEKGAVI
jgi:ankyrin repeat protein